MSDAKALVKDVKDDGERVARKAASHPWTEAVMRLGYAVRGVIYIVIGVLAVQVAAGARAAPTDQPGVIALIGRQPFGYWGLIVVAAGLAGYTLWSLIRAVLDPLRKGNDLKGLVTRAGYLISAAAYGFLMFVTIRAILNIAQVSAGSSGTGSQQAASTLLSNPLGAVPVALIGIAWAIAGALQIWLSWRSDLPERLDHSKLSSAQRKWMIRIGRFGTAARGVVFILIGAFFVLAAVNSNAGEVKGIDGALLALAQQPNGPWLLGIVAVGLVAFGAYSLLGALWFRLPHG